MDDAAAAAGALGAFGAFLGVALLFISAVVALFLPFVIIGIHSNVKEIRKYAVAMNQNIVSLNKTISELRQPHV